MSIEFNRWWKIKDGKFYEETEEGGTREIKEDYLIFPKATAEITIEKLKNMEAREIADKILEQEGAWSIVYFNSSLNKVFIGRDVFGRHSLVINTEFLLFGVRQHPNVPGTFMEVPYGQVTVFDLGVAAHNPEMFTYFKEYPQEVLAYFPGTTKTLTDVKSSLLNVSRATGGEVTEANARAFFEKVTDVTKVLLEKYTDSHLAVCFSGGVDSTLIAHVAHASVHSDTQIDLINVAGGRTDTDFEKVPDRKRAREAFASLQAAYPNRKFRMILVNVLKEELDVHLKQDVVKATLPANTVLDVSLSSTLWFAFRARGIDADSQLAVTSPASTCLLGSGADELLAGYSRHRNRLASDGVVANGAEECEAELRRLGSRNGGRDARVAAQLKKTIFSPFLEEAVVTWLNALPVDAKWDLSLPRGVGEKKLLRLALKLLGSPHDSPKQAMQFGSKISPLIDDGGKGLKGSDVSPHV